MLPSLWFGTRAQNASWCHPNSGLESIDKSVYQEIPIPFGLLLRGGCRGRFRPRSVAVLPPGQTGHFQRCAPLCGLNIRVLLRHLHGFQSLVVWCDSKKSVRQWAGLRDLQCSASPDRPWQGPEPAIRQLQYCWQRERCFDRTGGRCRRSRRPYVRCWDH